MTINWITSSFILFFISIYFSFYQVESREGRVIEGNVTQPGEFKYVVFVYLQDEKSSCTGGILSKKLVITAAHCVLNNSTNKFIRGRIRVLAGKNRIFREDVESGVLVKTVMVSKLYDARNVKSSGDIALLRLAEELSGDIEILNLPNSPSDYSKSKVYKFAGFGRSEVVYYNNGSFKDTRSKDSMLRKTDIIISPKCDGYHTTDHTICARMVNYKKLDRFGICKGDSGGPLVDDEKVVFGIVSYGKKDCNEIKRPTVFTKVYHYRRQILKALTGLNVQRFKEANETGYF